MVVRTAFKGLWSRDAVEPHRPTWASPAPARRQRHVLPGVLFWAVNGCNPVGAKVGESRYRRQFSYNDLQQIGSDVTEYTELAECVVQLLQTQSDYARMTGRGRAP